MALPGSKECVWVLVGQRIDEARQRRDFRCLGHQQQEKQNAAIATRAWDRMKSCALSCKSWFCNSCYVCWA